MKTKTTKTKPPRQFRNFPDEIDVILHGYVRQVVLHPTQRIVSR